MSLPTRLFVLSTLCGVSLAGCGSSNPAPTVPSVTGANQAQVGGQASSLVAWRAAVQCARRHGMTAVPDPVVKSAGRVTLPVAGPLPTPTPAVRSACSAQLRAIGSSASAPTSESPTDTQALLRVAACMRTHGFPRWPDPDPSQPGTFHVRSADAGTPARLGQGVSACGHLIPASGWHLRITPSGQ